MIDINKITDEIKLKSKLHDRQDIETEIDKRIRAGSTGGEILSMVGKYLSDLRKTDSGIYDLIKEEVKLFLKYCKSHGINII